MAKQRLAVSLDPETIARLDRLNAQRFGRSYQGRSIAVTWALDIAERVLSDPATITAQSGSEAFELFIGARKAVPSQPIPPPVADLLQRIDAVLKDFSSYPDTRIMDSAEAARQDIAETLTRLLLGREEED